MRNKFLDFNYVVTKSNISAFIKDRHVCISSGS